MRRFFDQTVGDFLEVDKSNMQFNPALGQIVLRKAEIRAEVFDELHFPVALRGGFIEEISINLNWAFAARAAAKVVVKNIFLVLGPHTTDWSWTHVYKCKTKLVELIVKILELKPITKKSKEKKVVAAPTRNLFTDMQQKLVENVAKKLMEMLEVDISGVHFRYEDSTTQPTPFCFGVKLGRINVSSAEVTGHRSTGDWDPTPSRCADPLFCQSIAARRISAYWDVGRGHWHFSPGPVKGWQVNRGFTRLNLRETFAACVVEKVQEIFPPGHKRRKNLPGPGFRERLDFHQYLLFPVSLSADITVNRDCEATQTQKAPLQDVDVVFEPVELAIDSEQVRSLNCLITSLSNFALKDELMFTRPQLTIRSAKVIGRGKQAAATELGKPNPLIREWWRYALQGVKLLSKIPKSQMDAEELKRQARLREEYLGLCVSLEEVAKAAVPGAEDRRKSTQERLRAMQMGLPLGRILDWRLLARARAGTQEDEHGKDDYEEEGAQEEGPMAQPESLQVHVHFKSFQAFFCIVAEQFWSAVGSQIGQTRNSGVLDVANGLGLVQPYHHFTERRSMSIPLEGNADMTQRGVGFGDLGFAPASPSRQRLRSAIVTRQLTVMGEIQDIKLQVVQKGHSRVGLARWVEMSIRNVEVVNCIAKPHQTEARCMVSVKPFVNAGDRQLCLLLGVTTWEAREPFAQPYGVPVFAVLEPWRGVAAHVDGFTATPTPETLSRIGFLKEHLHETGKQITFLSGRVGPVKALDYVPFKHRILHCLRRGLDETHSDLVRRPSLRALDREMLAKLQRAVEGMTGTSNMMGAFDIVLEGVQTSQVEIYNSKNVLSKEASLAPTRARIFRAGLPQVFQAFLHPLQDGESAPVQAAASLPWRLGLKLLPKVDFALGAEEEKRDTNKDDYPDLSEEDQAQALTPSPAPSPSAKKAQGEESHLLMVESGGHFLKWGRNGASKRRFVYVDCKLGAIVWKAMEYDNTIVGAIPLWQILDVTKGATTPLLKMVEQKSKHTFFNDACVWSVIAEERTLDLQASTPAQAELWVEAMKAKVRMYLEHQEVDDPRKLPWSVEKKLKVYPEKFRSTSSELRRSTLTIQALQALGRAVMASA